MQHLISTHASKQTIGGTSKAAQKRRNCERQPIRLESLEDRKLYSATALNLTVASVPTSPSLLVATHLPLHPVYVDPITQKYEALGGSSSSLGLSTSAEKSFAGGTYETFQNGAIFYTPATGAHDVCTAIADEFFTTAFERDAFGKDVESIIGYPTSDETGIAGVKGGLMAKFQDGVIYDSKTTGAHVLYGAINTKYNQISGWDVLGLPTNDEANTPDGVGRYVHFESVDGKTLGAIDWTQTGGAHAVEGQIALKFSQVGWEKIGEATTDQINITGSTYDGAYNPFATETAITFFGTTFDVPVKTSAINWSKQSGTSLSSATSYSDIAQGNSGTCWIDASIAALEKSGVDMSNIIQYQGNDWYTVNLNNFNNPSQRPTGGMHTETEWVYFDGTTYGADLHFNTQEASQSWALILQRAVIQAVHDWDPSQTIQNPHGGSAADALAILTGRAVNQFQPAASTAQQAVESALAANKAVVLGTNSTTSKLVADHCYAVLSANSQGVTLYNPWGSPVSCSWSVISQDGNSFFTV